MKPTSLEPVFAVITTPDDHIPALPDAPDDVAAEIISLIPSKPFTVIYDLLRSRALSYISEGHVEEAVEEFSSLDQLLSTHAEAESRKIIDVRAALKHLLVALLIEGGNDDLALATAAAALNVLATNPSRKDEPFLFTLAALLYDIAFLHTLRNEYKQAERELEKATRILERLVRLNPERYGSAHIMALNASTTVYRNRVSQAEFLASHQEATNSYLLMVKSGMTEATDRLIDSLAAQGQTLGQMGRHREAVQYFSRALKYLTRIEPAMSMRQLNLSIALGEAMLRLDPMRDKAIHLLNTMLHKATKLNAAAEHRHIVDILANSRSRDLDILGLWYKIFPK
ncbi:MAG: hypothetical protein NC098_08705 [Lachnoclostridium sp.]|nr:hypothetical protein [Lachnoclostridium sp.]